MRRNFRQIHLLPNSTYIVHPHFQSYFVKSKQYDSRLLRLFHPDLHIIQPAPASSGGRPPHQFCPCTLDGLLQLLEADGNDGLFISGRQSNLLLHTDI